MSTKKVKKKFRKGQLCLRCKKSKYYKLEYCECGCYNKENLICKTCGWTNF